MSNDSSCVGDNPVYTHSDPLGSATLTTDAIGDQSYEENQNGKSTIFIGERRMG